MFSHIFPAARFLPERKFCVPVFHSALFILRRPPGVPFPFRSLSFNGSKFFISGKIFLILVIKRLDFFRSLYYDTAIQAKTFAFSIINTARPTLFSDSPPPMKRLFPLDRLKGSGAMRKNEKEMFERSPILQAVFRLALPTVMGQIILVIYNMADTKFVSSLGTSQSGAVGVIFGYMAIIQAVGFMFLSAVSNLFGIGGSSVISRALGSSDTSTVRKVSYGEGVRAIPASDPAEKNEAETLRTEVVIPSTLERIGAHAFDHWNIRDIYIPESVTSIDETAFENNPDLTVYVLKDSYAEQFAQDHGLETVSLEKAPERITLNRRAFRMKEGEDVKPGVKADPGKISDALKYASSDESVVKAEEGGMLIGLNSGIALITVSFNDRSDSCLVRVVKDVTQQEEYSPE